jgi:PAS domain S-box-containing protein
MKKTKTKTRSGLKDKTAQKKKTLPSPTPGDNQVKVPIIGIGASAGGLETFELFFKTIPPDCSMAFVLVPHLDPGHASMLSEILQRNTAMTVLEAADRVLIQPNHVYIIPPDKDMAIFHGKLQLSNPEQIRGMRLPIDFLFRSLAEEGEGTSGAVVVTQDITEGKAAEEQIRWLASFPELNPSPVIEIDAEGTVTFANPATRTTLRDLGLPDDPTVFIPGDKEEILRLLREGSEPLVQREITLRNDTFLEFITLERGLQVARIYARNITDRKRMEVELRERVKELDCLYRISMLIEKSGPSLDTIFQGTVELIPAAWQDPKNTSARIIAGDREFITPDFKETPRMLSHAISVQGKPAGRIDVCIPGEQPAIGANPFLAEEQNLLTIIANRLGHVIGRIQADEALRESELKLKTLFGLLPVGVSVLDAKNRITYANPALEKILDLTSDELLRGGYRNRTYLTADGMPMPADMFASTHAVREESAVYDVETGIVMEDGRTVWVNVSAVPVPFPDWHIVLVTTDITDRKLSETIIREQFAEIASYYNNAPVGLAVLDTGLHFLKINRMLAEINGIPVDEHIGRTVQEIVPALAAPAMKITTEILRTGKPITDNEFVGETKAEPGVQHVWREGWFPITDPQGNITAFSVFVEDITDRKRSEETIRAALAEKEILLREIHHRVKNNLTGIISLIDLQIGTISDPVHIMLLKDLEARVRSMALVHDSLYRAKDLSRISAAAYIENLIRYLFQAYGAEPHIRCRNTIGDTSLPIETAMPCGLVITEILTNSLKHAFPDSFSCEKVRGEPCTIALDLNCEGGKCLIRISDNGIGMPKRTEKAKSTSLGLYLIRFIVEHQLRGTVEISTSGGTAYTIQFPDPAAKEQYR